MERANGAGEIAFIFNACRYEEKVKFILLLYYHKIGKDNIHRYHFATTWWICSHKLEQIMMESFIFLVNFFGEGELQ